MDSQNKNKGFSMVEVVIAVLIVGIISGVAIFAFSSLKNKQVLQNEVNNLISILEETRSLTTSGKEALNYGIFFEPNSNRTVQFRGDVYDPNSPTNKEYLLAPSVLILEVNLNGGGTEVVFERLKGETNDFGSIVLGLVDATTTKETVEVYQTGTIKKLN